MKCPALSNEGSTRLSASIHLYHSNSMITSSTARLLPTLALIALTLAFFSAFQHVLHLHRLNGRKRLARFHRIALFDQQLGNDICSIPSASKRSSALAIASNAACRSGAQVQSFAIIGSEYIEISPPYRRRCR